MISEVSKVFRGRLCTVDGSLLGFGLHMYVIVRHEELEADKLVETPRIQLIPCALEVWG